MYPSPQQIIRWTDDHGAVDSDRVRGFAATFGRLPFDADELTDRRPTSLAPDGYPPLGAWAQPDPSPADYTARNVADAASVVGMATSWLTAHPLALGTAAILGYLALTGGGRRRFGVF